MYRYHVQHSIHCIVCTDHTYNKVYTIKYVCTDTVYTVQYVQILCITQYTLFNVYRSQVLATMEMLGTEYCLPETIIESNED